MCFVLQAVINYFSILMVSAQAASGIAALVRTGSGGTGGKSYPVGQTLADAGIVRQFYRQSGLPWRPR